MKKFKKLFALAVAATMVLVMSISVFAASITINSTATDDEAAVETTIYTYYKILDASIEDASKIIVDPETGESTAGTGDDAPKVSYYVTTEAKATALEGLKVGEGENAKPIFNVVKDATQAKWYVELNKDTNASAEQIATALDGVKDTFATADNTFAQTEPGGSATADDLDAGYYLITSTLGDVLVVQTLADIEINTKNTYPGVDKTINSSDVNAQIGDEINYTLTVEVPESANDIIVLTDTMDAGLTFKAIDSVKAGEDDVPYTLTPTTPAAADKEFTITFAKDTVIANKGKTITIEYTAILNKDAVVETGIPNDLVLEYGNNYKSVVKTVETKTYKFQFDKVDGADTGETKTKLVGAEFELQLNETAINLVEVEAGKTYRIATTEDTTTTTKIVTNGNTITINGLDSDVTYSLKETKAPTGYNLLEEPVEVKATETEGEGEDAVTTFVFEKIDVENNKGSVLPSTGGIGTTIFYILGSILVIGAGVLLVTKRRMDA